MHDGRQPIAIGHLSHYTEWPKIYGTIDKTMVLNRENMVDYQKLRNLDL